MIPKECKRLAEVDFPIAIVSRHSAREKSIRHGHPSTLHLWWARRPLAACRAMLMALLLPDPADPACPSEFKEAARKALLALPGAPSKWLKDLKNDEGLRQGLLKFIGDFANWDVASDLAYLTTSRALVKAAHGDEPPLVVDPFAGGGSIPLEALRIGCDAFASDLNPVACLILKTMLEDIPRHGPGLADELRKAGAEIKEAAERDLAGFYPADSDGAKPIAYLWARTIVCDSCGAEIPLMRSFWLCKKASRKRGLKSSVHQHRGKPATIEFEMFTPRSDSQVQAGTVTRAKATCLACQTVLPPERVRAQLSSQRGGADVKFDSKGHRIGGATLLAVVTLHPKKGGRQYRIAGDRDYAAVFKGIAQLKKVAAEKLPNGLGPIPDEPTPAGGGSGAGRAFSVQKYGMTQFGDLFTARQKLVLSTLARTNARRATESVGSSLALVISRLSDYGSAQTSWSTGGEFVRGTFGRQALPIVWDFAEAVPWTDSSGNLDGAVDWVARVIETLPTLRLGQVERADACQSTLPTAAAHVWFTDPPYYDAIPYSDLSDFFFVWLKRSLTGLSAAALLATADIGLTPKEAEIVQDETKTVAGKPKDRAFFETAMARAFGEGRRVLHEDGIGSVVFAHKTTEGWEALLSGLVGGRWVITSSWPIASERPGRLRSQDSAALATSVHLVCRPRDHDAGTGDWADVARELPERISQWMERLTSEGVRGADLVFACIGPAMEIYSRYDRVEDAEGREIPMGGDATASEPYKRGFLVYVWETVGRIALRQVLGAAESKARNGASTPLEEDARLTALFLWTLQSTTSDTNGAIDNDSEPDNEVDDDDDEGARVPRGKKKGLSLIYDIARRFAQPLGIHLDQWEGRIIETDKGIVRLLPVAERAKQLFGDDGADAVAGRIEAGVRRDPQMGFDFIFDKPDEAPKVKGRKGRVVRDEDLATREEATTLDRVHAAMLLQSAGRSNALRAFLKAETGRGSEFLRLANALSALYPKESEEKRLLDAMILAVPR